MEKIKIATIIGTRPEIIKMSPLLEGFNKNFNHLLIHSGQHYDPELDAKLFKELELPIPDIRLKTGSGNFPTQLFKQMKGIQENLENFKPDFVVVQGDTNTALSGALVAARMGVEVLHIESGCRSGNLKAPEEQNRILIDSISKKLFCSDQKSLNNLKKEKKEKNAILVGSTTFDALARSKKLIKKDLCKKYNLVKEKYALVTLHRAEGMSELKEFKKKVGYLNEVSKDIPILFCVHPRTRAFLKKNNIEFDKNVILEKPLTHLEFISLLKDARFVISDSGGIQEEAAYFDRPCFVLRKETEWTRLIKIKKNYLIKNIDRKTIDLTKKVIHDEDFYRGNRKIQCEESKAGAVKAIIKEIKSIHK